MNDSIFSTCSTGLSKDVLVIPARNAWPMYKELYGYICQAGRAFRQVNYIAFYEGNKIQPIVPKILERHDHVVFESGKNPGLLGELVERAIEWSERPDSPYNYKAQIAQVFLLSPRDGHETVQLPQLIVNDMKSNAGRRIAFTQNQRYVTLESLLSAKTTSDLATE